MLSSLKFIAIVKIKINKQSLVSCEKAMNSYFIRKIKLSLQLHAKIQLYQRSSEV